MKTVILCGGRGTRLGEHGRSVPKALIKIGGKPILWHLIRTYSFYGMDSFVLCLGFLGDEIRAYFESNPMEERIEFVDTGLETNTGGRLERVQDRVSDDEVFCVTYGDGLSDINIKELIAFHNSHDKIATVTAIHPYSSFGLMDIREDNSVVRFREKPLLREWINGGFFVFDNRIFDLLGDNSVLEREPFEELCSRGEMMAYKHTGFWKCMDTFKDNLEFEKLWQEGAPWKVW